MKYAKLLNGAIVDFPYTWEKLQEENPYSLFDDRFSLPEWYAQTEEGRATGASIIVVVELPMPVVDVANFNLQSPSTPEFVNEAWVLRWQVLEKTAEEKAACPAVQAEIAAAGPAGGHIP